MEFEPALAMPPTPAPQTTATGPLAPPLRRPRPTPIPGQPMVDMIEALIDYGRFEDPHSALQQVDAVISDLRTHPDPAALIHAHYARTMLLPLVGASTETLLPAINTLGHHARLQTEPWWIAYADALLAQALVRQGNIAGAIARISSIDLEGLLNRPVQHHSFRLLDTCAHVYAQLRLFERMDAVRKHLNSATGIAPIDQATHQMNWAIDLSVRALESSARGGHEPDYRLLDQATDLAQQTLRWGSQIPAAHHIMATAVLALAAAYRHQADHALQLVQSAAHPPAGVDPLHAQLHTLAAIHAHALQGTSAVVRALDEGTYRSHVSYAQLIVEIAQARERLRFESAQRGDITPVLHRLTELLTRLAWVSMDLAAQTAQAVVDQQRLQIESRTDTLTELGNRRAFDEQIPALLRSGPLPVSLIVLDVDDFTGINDEHSREGGDQVLRSVAGALRRGTRPQDLLFRYEGDQFVAVLPQTPEHHADQIAQQLRAAIAALTWDGMDARLRVRATTGHAALWSVTGRRPTKDAQALFRRAEATLLTAKRARYTDVPRPSDPTATTPDTFVPLDSATTHPEQKPTGQPRDDRQLLGAPGPGALPPPAPVEPKLARVIDLRDVQRDSRVTSHPAKNPAGGGWSSYAPATTNSANTRQTNEAATGELPMPPFSGGRHARPHDEA